jgi:hypothetical protein
VTDWQEAIVAMLWLVAGMVGWVFLIGLVVRLVG